MTANNIYHEYEYQFKIKTTNSSIIISEKIGVVLVPGSLPDTIREIIFDDKFNANILQGVIPINTEIIVFGAAFNKPLSPGIFPNNVTKIKFGMAFNQNLEPGIFPVGITEITFGKYFSQPIMDNIFPSTVTHLKFGTNFKASLHNVLPPNLKYLNITYKYYDKSLIKNLPTKLKEFHMTIHQDKMYDIPEGVTDLYLCGNDNSNISRIEFPKSVQNIYLLPIMYYYNDDIDSIIKKIDNKIKILLIKESPPHENIINIESYIELENSSIKNNYNLTELYYHQKNMENLKLYQLNI